MAKALKCDRCGSFYDLITEPRDYKIQDFSEVIKYEKYVDLCPDCYKKLLNFLDFYGIDHQEMVGTGELYPGEFESRHYEFEDCDNIKGERVIRCQESR